MVGGRVVVTADGQDVDTRMSGFTVSPHEECAVEEAVRLTEREGGRVTVLTLGPPEAADQLRDMLALGAHQGVLLETDGREWGPVATAAAIAAEVTRRDAPFDLLLFGNEAADTGGYQVAVRVAHLLGLPVATGIKQLARTDSGFRAGREYRGAQESYDLALPTVVSVKEGINLPRYPSLPGRLRAKRAAIDTVRPQWREEGLRKRRLRVPEQDRTTAQILGTGTDAVPALVGLLGELGVLS
jgi:electron transfer flavoprotein beta subunit